MNPILQNILAVIAAFLIGSLVNMSIIELSSSIIPVPSGVDPSDVESIKANIHRYENIHFVFPFLAHALGTFVAALLAIKFVASKQSAFAYGIGAFFMLGGITAALMIGSPLLAAAFDIVFAYIPMSFLAIKLSK